MNKEVINSLKTFAERNLPQPIVKAISSPIYKYLNTPHKYSGRRYLKSKGLVIVGEAKQHYEEVSSIDKMSANDRWDIFTKKMQEAINHLATPRDIIYYAQGGQVGFDHRLPASQWRLSVKSYADQLYGEFPHLSSLIDELGDSPYSRPDTLLKYRWGLVSNVHFWHMWVLLQCLTYVKEPRIVCEIGGGYGALATLWLQNSVFHSQCYIDIDFPEALFFAEVFLRVNFNNLKILYVTSSDKLEHDVVSQYSVILCPTKFIDAISNLSLDLVINTGSLQEMNEEWVDFWMRWLRKQDCRWFYSWNYFAQPLDLIAEGNNSWSPRLTPEWTVRRQIFNPHIVRVHGIYHREFAEILAEKQSLSSNNVSELVLRYKFTKRRILDGQTLLEAMDVIRQFQDENIMWDLLLRCVTEMHRIPKEALYLSEYLNKYASIGFKLSNGDRLQDISNQLYNLRENGKADVT